MKSIWNKIKWFGEYIYKNTLIKIILSFALGSVFFLLDENFGTSENNILTYLWAFFYGIFAVIILSFIVYGVIIHPTKWLIKKIKG